MPRRAETLVVAALTAFSVGLGYYMLARPGAFLGVAGYDDGTYFGSSVRLVHGVIPYRDFVLVQPPGLPLLLSPFAALSRIVGTRDAFGAARLLMPLVLGAQVFLVGRLVRHRGVLPVVVACAVTALHPDARLAAESLLLEPFSVLLCLIGAVFLFSEGSVTASARRLVLGGVAFGLAGAVKYWAVFPVVVLAIMFLRWPRERLLPFAAGVAAGFLVPCLPFFLLDPGGFVRQTITSQLHRVTPFSPSIVGRLGDMTGAHLSSHPVTIAIAAGLGAVLVVGYLLRGHDALHCFSLFTTGAVVLALLVPAEYFTHYPAFLAPFAALALGLSLERLVVGSGLGGRVEAAAGDPRFGGIVPVARPGFVLAIAVGAAALAVHETQQATTFSSPTYPSIDRVVPPGACVVSDNASVLLSTNRFISSHPGCSPIVDASGTALVLDSGAPPEVTTAVSPALVATWQQIFASSDYIALTPLQYLRVPLGHGLGTYLESHFHPLEEPGLTIWVRNR